MGRLWLSLSFWLRRGAGLLQWYAAQGWRRVLWTLLGGEEVYRDKAF